MSDEYIEFAQQERKFGKPEKNFHYADCGEGFSSKKTKKTTFPCLHCESDFTSKGSLTRHYRRKHSEKMLDCALCQKKFTLDNDLQRHLISHVESKNCKCDICDETFECKKHLQNHNKTYHREERSIWITDIPPVILKEYHVNKAGEGHYIYRCNLCSKAFYLKSDLQRHFLIHSGEKPFQCDICDMKFNRKSNLVRHLRKQHELSDEKDKKLFVVNILTEDIDN